jgi:hypothetical protein
MPAFSNVAADLRDSISADLLQAQQSGTAIVTSGEFMMSDENNQPFPAAEDVILPDNGGQFQITTGDTPSPVTHVTSLPKRARLLTVTGTGHEIDFGFEGMGDVTVAMSPQMQGNFSIMGADSYTVNSGVLTLTFAAQATHNVAISAITPINTPPTTSDITVQSATETVVDVVLTASDIDGDALTYIVVTQPQHGVLSGVAPNLTYAPARLTCRYNKV